jgi:cysteine desulfurase
MSYFDNNATTPVHPLALEALTKASAEDWRNPSSPYRFASRTKAKLEIARKSWAEALGVAPEDFLFCSGATESNNWVIASAAQANQSTAPIYLSSVEHPSISEPAQFWFGKRVAVMSNNSKGVVCLDSFAEQLKSGPLPALVCVMAANNESGVVQPWMELAKLCSEYNVPFHCDATQWVGKMPISDLRFCRSFTASAHKFGGPKGVGWLVDQNFNRMQVGGSQEGGRRAGTENFPSIMAMGKAWEHSQSNYKSIPKHALWRDHFEKEVLLQISGTRIIGRDTDRLWNTSLLLMPRFDNLRWVTKLDKLGFEVSTGSACSSGSTTLSATAASFGLDLSEAKYLLRISSYFGHTEKDWTSLGEAMVEAYEQMKSENTNSNIISL